MPIALRLLALAMAPCLLSAIVLPLSGFPETLSSLLIATELVLGQLPDTSLAGVTHHLTLSGHVSLPTASEYGQVPSVNLHFPFTG